MGIYINPFGDTDPREKAKKIAERGKLVSREDFVNHTPGDDDVWGVAVVDNIQFIAAGIAFHKREAETFAMPDRREIKFYLMKFEDIKALDDNAANSLRSIVNGLSGA